MTTKQQYVLITGATSGIGFELAKLFAKDGYNLVIVGRYADTLQKVSEQLSAEYNVKVTSIKKDLFEKNAPFELYDLVKAKGIQIDVLVNDAGQGEYGEFVDTDIKREMDIIQLNVLSVTILTKLFLKDMVLQKSGKILNVASVAGKVPGPLQAVYHATKAFVHSFNEAVRNEIKDTGVTITSLLPGATDTDFFRKAKMLDAKNVQEGKLADPADVAKDGYDALMAGKDMVVSGLANKIQMALTGIIPDSVAAAKVHKQQEPVK